MSVTSGDGGSNEDDRLPLRWGVILAIAAGAGILAGFLGGPLAGLGAGLAVAGLFYKVLGN